MSHIYFEIQADDIERAMNFYKKIFGWKFHENPHAPVEYRWIETGGTRGGGCLSVRQKPRRRSAEPMLMYVPSKLKTLMQWPTK